MCLLDIPVFIFVNVIIVMHHVLYPARIALSPLQSEGSITVNQCCPDFSKAAQTTQLSDLRQVRADRVQ